MFDEATECIVQMYSLQYYIDKTAFILLLNTSARLFVLFLFVYPISPLSSPDDIIKTHYTIYNQLRQLTTF